MTDADARGADDEPHNPDGADTERTHVKTYVPAYQKERWREHADELDASLSEFVRLMVQAGRRGFDAADADRDADAVVRAAVLDALDAGPAPGDVLRAAARETVDDRLDDVLAELQERGRVVHGRDGYELASSDGDGE